jgi:chromosome segregation ATPase
LVATNALELHSTPHLILHFLSFFGRCFPYSIMSEANEAISQGKIERALLSEAEQFNRTRVLELERQVQDLMLADDFKEQTIERLRSELGSMTQLSNLAEQLKRDNAHLSADLEANQRFMRQEFSKRDNTSVQRDELTRKVRRIERKNDSLRKQFQEAKSQLTAANERAANLREHLAQIMQRSAQMEKQQEQGGGNSVGGIENTPTFGAALLERLEELEAELKLAKAASTRTTTRYVLREATEAFQPVYMEEVHTVTGRFNKVSGVFSSRKTAEMAGHLSKLKLDYKALSAAHEDMEKEYVSMVEETETLRRHLDECMKQLRNSRLQTAMKLAMQKSVLSKQKLSSALYMSRGGERSMGMNGSLGMGIGGKKMNGSRFLNTAASTLGISRSNTAGGIAKGNALQITPKVKTPSSIMKSKNLPKLKKNISKTKIVDVAIPSIG